MRRNLSPGGESKFFHRASYRRNAPPAGSSLAANNRRAGASLSRPGKPRMDETIKVEDRWYVLATSSRADDRTRVLKHGDTFALYDRFGDIEHIGTREQGLYHDGT